MRLELGPVASTSARVWTGWAGEALGRLRAEPAPSLALPAQVVDDLGVYVDRWARATRRCNGSFRWDTELDADELEYLTYAFYNFDVRLRDEVGPEEAVPAPLEGRTFHLVLVRALLDSLAGEGPTRAAFAEQLRPAWPSAVQAV